MRNPPSAERPLSARAEPSLAASRSFSWQISASSDNSLWRFRFRGMPPTHTPVKGRVDTVGWRRVGVVALSALLFVGLVPVVAAGSTHDAAVGQAEERLRQARARQETLTRQLDAAAELFERAQAHHLRLQEELGEVEQDVRAVRVRKESARESLRRRATAAYRAPHTDLALAAAVLGAPDAATAVHRANLMARLTIHAAHEVNDIREAETRATAGLRQRRIIQSGAHGAAEAQRQQADVLTAALRDAAREAGDAEKDLEGARARARAAEAAAKRAQMSAAVVLPAVDGKHCPVGGANGFIDSWGFPRSGGRRHQGVDMFAEHGTPLLAVDDGVVRRVYSNRLGGLSIDFVDGDGNRYYYAHLSAAGATSGQRVQAGEVIGAVGQSGNARGTPPHLHWQFHPDGGAPVNPYPLARTLCR